MFMTLAILIAIVSYAIVLYILYISGANIVRLYKTYDTFRTKRFWVLIISTVLLMIPVSVAIHTDTQAFMRSEIYNEPDITNWDPYDDMMAQQYLEEEMIVIGMFSYMKMLIIFGTPIVTLDLVWQRKENKMKKLKESI